VSALDAVSAILAVLTFWVDENNLKLMIVISSAGSGFIAFRECLRMPYELWMYDHSTCHILLDLRCEIRFFLDENSTEKKSRHTFNKCKILLLRRVKHGKQLWRLSTE
jgi:hypothetical protein